MQHKHTPFETQPSNIQLYHIHLTLGSKFKISPNMNNYGYIPLNRVDMFSWVQHVSIPTHDAGNTLDLVLTRDDLSVSSIFTDHSVTSDHSAVLFTISCASPGVVKKSITYRKWKSIDVSSV